MSEFIESLAEAVMEADQRSTEARRQHATESKGFWDWMERHGIELYDLPGRAQVLIWRLDSGEPIHPKDAEYLKGILREKVTA